MFNHLLLRERGVQLRHHDVAILACMSANLLQLFLCFNFVFPCIVLTQHVNGEPDC